ncbi:MAG: alpha/beta hydrolase domain-containing protein, partial [Myxococcales bacterium]
WNGTLAPPLPQSGMGFPHLPGVTYTGLKTTRYRFNFGPNFYETGIATINPPVITAPFQDNPANGPIYPSFIPITDSDGNDIAGVRLADVAVPVATYTGWALRSGVWANDGCESSGQYIPFPKTKTDRMTTGDPRSSVEERYSSLDDYAGRVAHALQGLVDRRLMLCEDFNAEFNRLVALGKTQGLANLPVGTPDPAAPVCVAPHRHHRGHHDGDHDRDDDDDDD